MPEHHEAPASAPPGARPRLPRPAWVSTTYFAEGLPYMVVRYLAFVYLTDIGVKEAYLGFLNFLGWPWNLKFLWAPALDIYATKRAWLVRAQSLLTVLIALMALCVWLGPAVAAGGAAVGSGAALAALPVRLLLVLLVASAFFAATHDVAIDGYYMEAITDPGEQAAYTGLRIMSYRIAVIFVRSALVAAAGLLAWTWSFAGAALVLGLLFGFHALFLNRVERPRARTASMAQAIREYGKAFASYFDRPKVAVMVMFIATYKIGDEILFSMNTPFLMRALGVSKTNLAWMAGMLGVVAAILGSLFSAWAIRRFTLRRVIWPLTLAMNVNIWAYVWLAWTRPDAATAAGLATIAAVVAYEQFAGGIGNAVLMVYAMRTCKPEFKAAHYAFAGAMWSLIGNGIAGMGGIIVERVGYVWLFMLAFIASLPSMACLFFLPLLEEKPAAAAAPAAAAPATTGK